MYVKNRFTVVSDNDSWIIIDCSEELIISYSFNNQYDAWHICNNLNYLNNGIDYWKEKSEKSIWKKLQRIFRR